MKTKRTVLVYTDSGKHGASVVAFVLHAKHPEKRGFKDDWDAALSYVQSHNPEWSVLDVEKRLRRLGWKITSPNYVPVDY